MKKESKNTNVEMIKLKHLVLSEYNVRSVPATKEENKLLKASIKALGIKQNLVVIPLEGLEKGVVAGGRRLEQMDALLSEGHLSENYLVPCMIESPENITAISLSENIKASMHPADEFAAFQLMIDDGKTIAEISNEFGVTQSQVKKRLKLAGVAGELLDLYRAGKLNLDHIMAFTVSDDHERQMACYKQVKNSYINTYNIKKILLDTALLSSNGMVKLVTLKTYKKAGGTTNQDLFDSKTYINNRDLIEMLALEILNKKAKSFEKKWKWVDVSLDDYSDYETTLEADFKDVPDKITKELELKTKALDELNDKDYSDWTDEDDDLETELEACIELLENKRYKYRCFTEEQKAVSGVVISFDNDGEITVNYGYVKKEDMELAFPQTKPTPGDTLENTKTGEQDTSIESNSLKTDLGNFKLQAVQSELMKDDKLTYDLMVFSLASRILNEDKWLSLPLDTTIRAYDFNATAGIEETTSNENIRRFLQSLATSWDSLKTEAERFTSFRELTNTEKKRILSYCTALSYRSCNSDGFDSMISDALNFNIADHWTPNKTNYFSRIKKNDLLELGGLVIGEQWTVENTKLSKGQIVDKLDCDDSMADWMPESMK